MRIRFSVAVSTMIVFAAVGLLAQDGPSPSGPKNQDADELHFISKPSPTARVNVPYAYTALAITSDSTATIRYSGYIIDPLRATMLAQPLPIDSVTGVVNWTPTIKGWYELIIAAMTNKGGHARQEFNLLVSGGQGTIQGRVTDTLGVTGIPNIIVQALKTDNTPVQSSMGDDGGFISYSAKTDANGYYTIAHVDAGSYVIHAVSPTPDYASQWYDGKTEAALANVVTVADSSVTIIPIQLRAGPTLHPKVTVSGRVTDTLGAALKAANTRVFFVRAGFVLNSNSSVDDFRESFDDDDGDDFRIDGSSPYVFSTKVDTLGNYSMKIPIGPYIAFARAAGYITNFFLNQTDFTSANVLVLASDSSNINFTMFPLPTVALGGISGNVIDSSQDVGVRARVIAFRDHWRDRDDYHFGRTYTTDTDSTGAYSFSQLLPGSYIVFAIPVGNYAPAYYTTDTSNTRWKHATRLTISGNTLSGIDIYVRLLPAALQGYTGMTGSVKANGQGGVAGAFVYAEANGQVSGYGITDNSGNYSINGLAPGTYVMSIDKTGFDEVASQSATVSYSNKTTTGGQTSTPVTQNVNFSISGTASVTVPVTNVVKDYSLQQNYPNPFNPSTTIAFALPQSGIATLKVYNILGQEVATLLSGFQKSGSHQVLFDGTNLSSGVYFYKLQSGNFVQSKKMVLLK